MCDEGDRCQEEARPDGGLVRVEGEEGLSRKHIRGEIAQVGVHRCLEEAGTAGRKARCSEYSGVMEELEEVRGTLH